MRTCLLVVLLILAVVGVGPAQDPPRLSIMGSNISFGSWATLTLTSDQVGAPGLILVGLQPLPLDLPIFTAKGPYYLGQLALLVPCGSVPASGRIDLPFTLPPTNPILDNVHVAVQGYVGNQLTNPATIPFVAPHLAPQDAVVILPPLPKQGANFGDRFAVGDFNDDGQDDLAVGAWFETVAGHVAAGRAYVMWGPDFSTFVQLSPPSPGFAQTYGETVMAADLDLDGVDDLVIGEDPGNSATTFGHFYIFRGGEPFSGLPAQVVSSAGVGVEYTSFGRMATLGDLNGDDYPDLVVGVYDATVGSIALAGRVDIYFGPDFVVRQEIVSPTPGPNDFFGSWVVVADMDGNGAYDLVEGSGRTDVAGEVNIGRCHIFYGPSLDSFTTIECPLPDGFNTRFGDAVAGFDANEDGRCELITRDDRDNVYVFWSPSFTQYELIRRPLAITDPVGPSPAYAYYLSWGDINLDQVPDLITSDTEFGPASGCGIQSDGGYAYVAYGPHYSTFSRLSDLVQCSAYFGGYLYFNEAGLLPFRSLVVGERGAASAGLAGSGRVVVFQ